jgi:hypothetical protein
MVSFASSIIRQLAELEIVLERVCRLRTALTVNFDIFEHTLKMKLQEISSLFPLGKEIRPSEVIQDSTARNVWDSHFVGRYHVTFSEFVRMLMENKLVNMSDSEFFRFERYLRYFLDFPQEDMVSPYKWNWLIRTFGPCKDFYANFIRIATGKGFVGLMNRIQAYEILTLSHRSKVYLIRMSRTEPEYLAFSYRNSEGHIGHQINKDPESSLPIPVDLFIQTKFHNYEPVDRFVDIQRVLETENLHEYATFPRQYA